MIVASLLLILVAVTLLVLGLTGGSSNLLISSIVASLLAAVALVIGARQNASARRAADSAAPPDPAAPPTEEFAAPAEPFAAEPAFAAERPLAEPEFAAEPDFFASRQDQQFAAEPAGHFDADSDRRETVQLAAATDDQDDRDRAYEAGPRDTAAGMAGTSGARRDDDLDAPGFDRAEPDYDLASDAINAARSGNAEDSAWRRPDAHAEPAAADLTPDGPAVVRPGEARGDAGLGEGPGSGGRDSGGLGDGGLGAGRLGDGGLGDEGLAEADDEDPADEPLPQTVSPGDAVRVARMDAEVLVVDGRPRYHVPDCQHLVGKLSEPIPINEAVELGFSPCGLCRPVDRLVAAAARP